jgi:type I restriction enzyme S subunit
VNWQFKKLGEVLRIQNGYAFDSKKFSPDGDMPLIRIRDIKKGIDTETSYSGEYDLKYVVKKGDLLIGMDGEFGCYEWKGKDSLLNQRVCRLQDFDDLIHPRFLFYGINSYLKEIESVTNFITVKHLSSKQIVNIDFPLPSFTTQQKIVAKLDAIFAEIDKAVLATEANIKNAESLFKCYLFEVFEQGGPEWTDKKLTDVAIYMGRGKSKHRPRNDMSLYGGEYPFIQTGDVRNSDKFITTYTQTYNEKGLAQSKLWKANTVCITIAANIAEIGILGFDACFPDSVIGVVVDKEKVSEDFLYLMLLFAQQRIKDKSKGSAQENINLATFEDMLFKVAPLEQQKIIIQKFNDLKVLTDVIRDSNLKKLNDFSNLKNSILKKAFSGELVKD